MKIHYSPYFNGKAYIDYSKHNGGLLGECIESTAGLLSRLELIAGLSYPESDDESEKLRQEAYYKVLKQVIKSGSALYDSFLIDTKEVEAGNTELQYRVTAEILSWRDHLILAGWDYTTPLPGKLAVISEAEKLIDTANPIHTGDADRWFAVSNHTDILKAASLEISVYCPKILIPKLVNNVLEHLNAEYKAEQADSTLNKDHCSVYCFNNQVEAYEWLATQQVKSNEVIICKDDIRLDCILREFNQPEAGDVPKVNSHHVINDLRCMLDSPESAIWIDCNGDYGFTYPYEFLEKEELAELSFIPSKSAMLEAVSNSMIDKLNHIGKVILVKSITDEGAILTEHPFISTIIYSKNGPTIKEVKTAPDITTKTSQDTEIRFENLSTVKLNSSAFVKDVKYSATSIEKLISNPFDFVMEYQAGLWENDIENLALQKGNLAHKIIELMVERHKDDPVIISEDYFDEMFEAAKEATKADNPELFDEVNRFELDKVEETMRQSTQVLADIIAEQKLTPIGCEITIDGQHTDFGKCQAKIDMVLKKADKEYVIFDFKYSANDSYLEKLATNTSTQLAFYKEMFDNVPDPTAYEKYGLSANDKIVAYGYYLFPLQQLLVPAGSLGSDILSGKHIRKVYLNETNAKADSYNYLTSEFSSKVDSLKDGNVECKNVDYPKHIVLKNQIR